MKDRLASEKGFTLIEILIVLAVLAVMAAVVIPNISGFLNRGKENAYKSDQRILQAAVDGWKTEQGNQSSSSWPVIASTNTISIPQLVTNAYLKDNDAVGSANTSTMTGATNSPSGSYTWGIKTSTGVVTSTPSYSAGVYP